MAEQLIRNEQVGGSIPFTSSTEKASFGTLFLSMAYRTFLCYNQIRTKRPVKGGDIYGKIKIYKKLYVSFGNNVYEERRKISYRIVV